MKVELTEKKTPKFEDLDVGQTFISDDNVYIKIPEARQNLTAEMKNVVDLENGFLDFFDSDIQVTPHKMKVVSDES